MLHLRFMEIAYTATALKQLKKMAPKASETIRAKIRQYAADPSSLANQVKKLRGQPYLRLRVGDYRIVFSEDGIVMTILRVGHRREVYH